MNGKEALDNIELFTDEVDGIGCLIFEKEFNIIRKDLDRLEQLEQEHQKLKAAIEILQKIYVFRLQDIKCSGFYKLLIPDITSDELTKEEYDLLKEVLNER